MTHDVFISYASDDKPVADAACAVLERRGIRCWIAPRDVTPGMEWSGEIIRAINGSALLVLVFSRHANESPQVSREVERAVAKGIPIVPFRIEDIPASETLEYFISTPHWLDALTPPLERHLEYLAETVVLLRQRQVPKEPPEEADDAKAKQAKQVEPPILPNARGLSPTLVRGALGVLALIAVVYVLAGWYRGRELRDWMGSWTTDAPFQGAVAHWSLEIGTDARYRSSVQTRDAGTISFVGRTYRMVTGTGQEVSGEFDVRTPSSASIGGPLGTATWTRSAGKGFSPVGSWTLAMPAQGVDWIHAFRIEGGGAYEMISRAEDSGKFSVSTATWFLNSERGHSQNGTFSRIDDRTMTMTGPLGTATWVRKF